VDFVSLSQTPPPALRDPALVVAFTGRGDAGSAASSAALLMLRGRQQIRLADLDPEAFYVLTRARPIVRDSPRGGRIHWPSLTFLAGRSGGDERDLVVLAAAEPHLRWRGFAEAVAETWQTLGGGPGILLGAFLAQVLHVGPVPLVGSGSSPRVSALLRALGVAPSEYAGPATALTPIQEALTSRGIDCADVWAAVPSYLAPFPNPKAAAALLRVVSRLLEVRLEASDLDRAAARFEARVNQAFSARAHRPPGTGSAQASAGAAASDQAPTGPLPTGEEAIRDVERLLGLGPGGESAPERGPTPDA